MNADELVRFLAPYVQAYGYILVFLGVFLENSAFLGLIVPGETILILAAFYAARGDLDIGVVIVIAFVGAVLGDNAGYLIGRRGGRPFFKKYGKYFFVSERRMLAVERYFEKHGGKTIFIARFTSFLRALVAVAAGISRMDYRQFFLYDLAGAAIWAVVIGLLGYFVGDNWPWLARIIDRIGLGLFALILLAIATGVYLGRRRRRRFSADV